MDASGDWGWVKFANKVAVGQSFARIKAFTTNMSATAFKNVVASKFVGVKLLNMSFAYDGKVHSLAVTGTVPRGVVVTYSGNSKVTLGTCAVTAKLAYAKTGGSKKLSINKNSGKIRAKKAKKGSYEITVRASMVATGIYNAASTTCVVKVKVK